MANFTIEPQLEGGDAKSQIIREAIVSLASAPKGSYAVFDNLTTKDRSLVYQTARGMGIRVATRSHQGQLAIKLLTDKNLERS